jgi:glycosyltransferase involved in cell wall biosynthesis
LTVVRSKSSFQEMQRRDAQRRLMSDPPSGPLDSGATPAVSVIIPAYNSAAYIGDALRSVLAQTYERYEIMVINDGSPDTENLERELQRFSPSLRYIKQENRGVAAARNAGIRVARGEFIAFLDSDDTWMPTFLEKQLDLIERSKADVVYSDAMLFGDSTLAGQTFMKLQGAGGEITTERLLNTKVSLQTSTVLARKDAIVRVGLFNESLRRGQDFELWFRLAKEGFRFACHSETLANHRIVESGLSGGTISKLRRTLSVLEAIEARYELTPGENDALQFNKRRTLRELALENGKEKLLNRDFDGARKAFGEARKLRTGWKVVLVAVGLVVAPGILCGIYQRREQRMRRPA